MWRPLFRAAKLSLRGDLYKARHVLDDAWVERRVPPAPTMPTLIEVRAQFAPPTAQIAALREPVDIIIPVFNGPQHLKRLFATVFDCTDPMHRFLLADDASTDPATLALLEAASSRPNVTVLRAQTNRGFVANVNRAMAEVRGHAALLNTDTEVPPGWLDRLMHPILAQPRIASATPFSNSAATFSFPTPNVVNPLPDGLHLAQLDAAFARLSPAYDPSLIAPAGIGFCMGVNLAAWRALGPFDASAFDRGYGEETDWCLRAAAAGWKNLLVPNLFVYHEDGGTFGSAAKRAILEVNLRVIHRRWPSYRRQLATQHRRDPWASRRAAAILALATAQPGGDVHVIGPNPRGEFLAEAGLSNLRCAIGPIAAADPATLRADLGRLAWS